MPLSLYDVTIPAFLRGFRAFDRRPDRPERIVEIETEGARGRNHLLILTRAP